MSRYFFRGVGPAGAPYPPHVQKLKGKHGVYIIRDRVTRTVLYVGESHTCRLYETLTRHLQAWGADRWGHHGRPHRWHASFPRPDIEVATRITRDGGSAIRIQDNVLRRLHPTHNYVIPCEPEHVPIDDELVPF